MNRRLSRSPREPSYEASVTLGADIEVALTYSLRKHLVIREPCEECRVDLPDGRCDVLAGTLPGDGREKCKTIVNQ